MGVRNINITLFAKLLASSLMAFAICACSCLALNSFETHAAIIEDDGTPLASPMDLAATPTPQTETTVQDNFTPANNNEVFYVDRAGDDVSSGNFTKPENGMPNVIQESDGTTWTKVNEIEAENGSVSHVYEAPSSIEFDDGGLGDAELIINE